LTGARRQLSRIPAAARKFPAVLSIVLRRQTAIAKRAGLRMLYSVPLISSIPSTDAGEPA
jgi:hypothetical protein